jgi:hypothetical protein
MRRVPAMLLAVTLSLLTGCFRQPEHKVAEMQSKPAPVPTGAPAPAASSRADSFVETPASQSTILVTPRKVIRNAELTIETDSPADGKRKIEVIAESHGGFVITSEITDRGEEEAGGRTIITVVVRIPTAQFGIALEEIRKVGKKIRQEKITGQDVTEEFVDLEARLKAKRALEVQFLEIMKQARDVKDALEVQRALADVRGEIEQMEGRRRFLENRVSLSTVTVTLQTPTPFVSASSSGFWQGVRRAFGEGFDAALEVILFIIRLILVLIPIVLFIALPVLYLLRRFRRRRARLLKEPVPKN